MLSILAMGWIALPMALSAQTPATPSLDRRVAALTTQINDLKRVVAEQDRRLAELEKIIESMRVAAVPAPLPSPIPAWHTASNWNQLKLGMSRENVVQILGPASREETVIDAQTLTYATEANSAHPITGVVKLVGDRVVTVTPPAF
jgi:hypothetical protein